MEIRRVPVDWDHPRDASGHPVALLRGSFSRVWREWRAGFVAWEKGAHQGCRSFDGTYLQWTGGEPRPSQYMPDWEYNDTTCYQVYETTTGGTPLSPVFADITLLATWASRNLPTSRGREGKKFQSVEKWIGWIEDQIDSRAEER